MSTRIYKNVFSIILSIDFDRSVEHDRSLNCIHLSDDGVQFIVQYLHYAYSLLPCGHPHIVGDGFLYGGFDYVFYSPCII